MMSMDDQDETRPIDLSAWDVPDESPSWSAAATTPTETPESSPLPPEASPPEKAPADEAQKPAEKTTWQMGERERLRRAKKKNQRMIAAIIGFLAVAIVVLTICLTHKLYRDSHTKEEEGVSILQLEEEEDNDVFPGLYRATPLEYPEPYVEEDEPDVSINYFDRNNNSYDDYSSDENTVPIVSSISGDTTNTNTSTNTTTNTTTNSSTTTNTTGTTTKKTTGTTTNKTTKTTTVKTLKSFTLYCSVSKATKGGTATLSYKAVNNQGTDVTNQCTVSFSAENCTVSNKTVTFDKVGTAKITATVHYKLSKKTDTVSITVSEAAATSTLASATLSCSNTAPTLGQTGNLSVKVVDNTGADVTSKSTVTYTPSNCTVSNGVVTFGTEGTASVTASVTYNGKTINTNTLSFTVSKAAPTPQAVTLSCTPSTDVKQGDTGTLSALVTDASGADITSSCTLTYEAVSGCTVSGSTVTFDTVGSAVLKVTATSGGQSVSGELTVTVSAKPALKSCQLVIASTTVEKGSQQTLSVVATDENGNEIQDVEIQYSGDKCSISGNTVTFGEAGTATISATVTYNGVATVADPVTVYVQVNRSLSDGTKINVSDVSQKAEDSTYGYSLGLPSYFTAQSSETAGEKSYSYEKLGMTVKLTGTNRAEDDTTTVSQLYRDRMAALEADGAVLDDSSVDKDKGCYVLRWEKDGTVYEETVYVGEKATNTLLISYSTEQKDISSEIAEYISATFQAGDLTTAH